MKLLSGEEFDLTVSTSDTLKDLHSRVVEAIARPGEFLKLLHGLVVNPWQPCVVSNGFLFRGFGVSVASL